MNNIYLKREGMPSRLIGCAMILLFVCTSNMQAHATMSNGSQQPTTKAQAPTKTEITGKVVDEKGLPVFGVAVTVKGIGTGTSTNDKGEFTLNVPDLNSDLQFSYVGMEPQTYALKGRNNIKVVMKETSESIGEVIVTGMEVIKKDHMTGSASVLTSKDMKMQGITSIDRILEGKIAGLNSTTISGAPGARSQITIRGENNLTGNTEPLWIVDGLPLLSGVPKSNTGDYAGTVMQDGVGNIMPEDIESIAILKDAAASAIYGAKAANGVIVITTKKGYRSKTMINYSGTYENSTAPRADLGFMNASEKLRYEKSIVDFFGYEYTKYAGLGGYLLQRRYDGFMSEAEYQSQIDELGRTNTDWYKTIFRNAQSHSHNVSISGGSETMTYYSSINFQQKDGVLRSNNYQAAGGLFKLDYRPVKGLILELNLQANTRKNRDHASAIDPFNYAVFANPYEKPFNDDGSYATDRSYLPRNYTAETASGYKYYGFNILREMEENTTTSKGLDANLTFRLNYEFLKGFNFESLMRTGVSYTNDITEIGPDTYTGLQQEKFAKAAFPGASFYPSEYNNGELSESAGRSDDWSIRNQLNYSFDIKTNHYFSFLLATETTSKKTNSFGYNSPIYNPDYRITGIPEFDNEDLSYDDMRTAIASMFNTSDMQARTVSFIGSARYSFKDRYVVDFTYRADGADIIGDGGRYTPLWSVGGRYNLHHENWFKNNILTNLALKASYGYTGNIDRNELPFSTINLGSNSYLGDRYISSFTYPNPTIQWEKKRNFNVGVDLGFLNGRFNLAVDYYNNRTSNLIDNLEVPNSTGRTSVRANGGIIDNSGIEVFFNAVWINNNNFSFSTSFNAARNKNIIVKSQRNYDSYTEAIKGSVQKGGVINITGEETGSIFGWKQLGINPMTGNPRYALSDAGKREYAKMLDAWATYTPETQRDLLLMMEEFGTIPDIVDYNKDGVFGNFLLPSMDYLGRTNPLVVGGFGTRFRYKNIEFTTDWTFKVGHLIPSFSDYQNAPNNISRDSERESGYTGDLLVSGTNRQKKYLQYWKSEGDISDVPRFHTGGNASDHWSAYQTSEKYEKGDYLRMTNLSVSYRFPTDMISKWGLKQLSVGFNARNLITFTQYKGIDVANNGSFAYPSAREYNIRLSIGF